MTTAPVLTLTDFLLARIAEEEELARSAPGPVWERVYRRDRDSDTWHVRCYVLRTPLQVAGLEAGDLDLVETVDSTPESLAAVNHAAHWSPARVLAECEAKRRIVEQLAHCLQPGEPDISPEYDDGYIDALDFTVKLLALPYADHPDYQQEWRP